VCASKKHRTCVVVNSSLVPEFARWVLLDMRVPLIGAMTNWNSAGVGCVSTRPDQCGTTDYVASYHAIISGSITRKYIVSRRTDSAPYAPRIFSNQPRICGYDPVSRHSTEPPWFARAVAVFPDAKVRLGFAVADVDCDAE
jgi:hypothetical protein